MTDAELEEIEARAKAATRGPWKVDEMELYIHGGDGFMVASKCPMDDKWQVRGHGAEVSGKRPEGSQDANAAFIAHVREDVPVLIAEVKRLRENASLVNEIRIQYASWCSSENANPIRLQALLLTVHKLTFGTHG